MTGHAMTIVDDGDALLWAFGKNGSLIGAKQVDFAVNTTMDSSAATTGHFYRGDTTVANRVLTLVATPTNGRIVWIKNVGAGNTLTLTPGGADTTEKASLTTLQAVFLRYNSGTTNWEVMG